MSQTLTQIPAELDFSQLDAGEVRTSLELAALLGPEVDPEEWSCACELQGIARSQELLSALSEQGVVDLDVDTGRFRLSDSTLREQLSAESAAEGRARGKHLTCAQALFTLYPERQSGVAARRAMHLYKARHFEEALTPLLHAAKEAYDCGDFDAARDHLDLRAELLDELGVGADEPRRAQNLWRRAKLVQTAGDAEQAKALLEKSRRVLECTDWASERGHAALLHGRILRDEGQYETARDCFEQAAMHFGAAGDNHGLATSRASRGAIELHTGQYQRARQSFLRALATFELLGDRYMIASLLTFIAQTWVVEDNEAKAREAIARARRVAREDGHVFNEAGALIALGEIARKRRDWAEAKAHYAEAAKLYGEVDNRSLHISRYNLALVEVGAGNFDAARGVLEELEHQYPKNGLPARLPLVYVGLMTCAAGQGDWQAFDEHHAATVESIDGYGTGHDDIVWMAQEAIKLADKEGHLEARRKAGELACAQLERLGYHEQAEQLSASLELEEAC